MRNGKNTVVVASDKEKVGLRPQLKSYIEQNNGLEVVLLSRLKTSRIRGEIAPKNPALVFLTASLYTAEEFDELWGFVKKLRKHLPKTYILIHTPPLYESQREKIFAAGVDAWIDETQDYLYLGRTLEALAKGEELYSSRVITKAGLGNKLVTPGKALKASPHIPFSKQIFPFPPKNGGKVK